MCGAVNDHNALSVLEVCSLLTLFCTGVFITLSLMQKRKNTMIGHDKTKDENPETATVTSLSQPLISTLGLYPTNTASQS